ncbi:MAG TPA: EAL domain-containing protein [Acidimicrobiales bacterium]|nr:EAL domain-containing protein [Acidimicrobiales bacterium]
MAVLDVLVGRQPIFDRDLSVIGYELLFRTVGAETADGGGTIDTAGSEGDRLTAEVLFSSVSIGIDHLVGNKKLFCNASRGVLTGAVPILLPPGRTVVEILESVVPDDEVLAGCRRLRDEGFTLALDDFTWCAGAEALLELASIVKIDLRITESADLPDLLARCRRFDVALLAEKVETTDELRRCEALGFDYFQGYLLSRPLVVPGRALDSGHLSRLRVAARLLDSECPVAELVEIVRSDPAMTHQILQLAGIGAASGMQRTVQTVHEALVLVGWRRLQSWVALLLMTGKGRTSEEGITTALIRARMCELVAPAVDSSLEERAFTAGMLSCFGVLLGMPLETVLGSLPLDDDLRDAVLTGCGTLGALVADVTDYLLGQPDAATRSGVGEDVLSAASLEALTWAVEMTSGFDESVHH